MQLEKNTPRAVGGTNMSQYDSGQLNDFPLPIFVGHTDPSGGSNVLFHNGWGLTINPEDAAAEVSGG